MSIALESRRSGGGGFPFDAQMLATPLPPPPAVAERSESGASSCSSSIGRNSDCSAAEEEDDAGESEVQSDFKGPLDTMDALEDSLPIKQGVSNFYRGKSKSFTSLEDVMSSCSSIKDLAKPENQYTRKRKNLLGFSTTRDRMSLQDSSLNTKGSGIPKRLANSSRTLLNFAVSTSSSGSNDHSSEDEHETSRLRPPLHPRSRQAVAAPLGSSLDEKFSFPVRSFSLTDLQGAACRTE